MSSELAGNHGSMLYACAQLPICPLTSGFRVYTSYSAPGTQPFLYDLIELASTLITRGGFNRYEGLQDYSMNTRSTALNDCLGQRPDAYIGNTMLQSHWQLRYCQDTRRSTCHSMSSGTITRQSQPALRNNLVSVARHAVPDRRQEQEVFLPEVSKCEVDHQNQTSLHGMEWIPIKW